MLAFIVQARLGSTRLPNKILLPFYANDSIIDLLILKLEKFKSVAKLVVATSENETNNPLITFLSDKGISFFRGSENDVLERFISTAEHFNIDRIVRICSDNPFIDIDAIEQLLNKAKESTADYISFSVNGTPSIKTHFGFWGEYVTLAALKKVSKLTKDPLYREHVTNYIYSHPQEFEINWIEIEATLSRRTDIRLTVDTKDDFQNAQNIFCALYQNKLFPSINKIVSYLDLNPEYLISMKNQINKNNK